MMKATDTRAMLLAVGNSSMGDDGVGAALLRRLARDYRLPAGVELLDGGCQPLALYERLAACPWLILLDGVRDGTPAGQLRVQDPVWLPRPPAGLAVHQLGAPALLQLLAVLGDLPARLSLVGVSVGHPARGWRLSPALRRALPEACLALVALLATGGLRLRPRPGHGQAGRRAHHA